MSIFTVNNFKYYRDKADKSDIDWYILAHFYGPISRDINKLDQCLHKICETSTRLNNLAIVSQTNYINHIYKLQILHEYLHKFNYCKLYKLCKLESLQYNEIIIYSQDRITILAILYAKLAYMYIYGHGTEIDFVRAKKYCKLAIILGNNEAMKLLCNIYYKKYLSKDKDNDRKIKYSHKYYNLLKRYCKSGSIVGIRDFGNLHNVRYKKTFIIECVALSTSKLTLPNSELNVKMIKYYKRVLVYWPNYPMILVNYACACSNNMLSNESYEIYHRLAYPYLYQLQESEYETICLTPDFIALYNIALMYMYGYNKIKKNHTKALSLFKYAAKLGNQGALYNIIRYYSKNNNLEVNSSDNLANLYRVIKYYKRITNPSKKIMQKISKIYMTLGMYEECFECVICIIEKDYKTNSQVYTDNGLTVEASAIDNNISISLYKMNTLFYKHGANWTMRRHKYITTIHINKVIILLMLISKNRSKNIEFLSRVIIANIIPYLLR